MNKDILDSIRYSVGYFFKGNITDICEQLKQVEKEFKTVAELAEVETARQKLEELEK